MIANAEGGQAQTVNVRPMIETDHVDADRIFRMAFGTFLGLPDPMAFAGTTISTARVANSAGGTRRLGNLRVHWPSWRASRAGSLTAVTCGSA